MQTKNRLHEAYDKTIAPKLAADFGVANPMAVPKPVKVTLNVGLKPALKDPKFIDAAERTIVKIAGQKPVRTIAKKAISNFKTRKGMVVGMMVTLRGRRMYEFLDKLVSITLPRVRDFRGLAAKSVDARGNLSLGFKDFLAFPEITAEDTDYIHGLEVTVTTTAGERAKGRALLEALGFPLKDDLK
jgi:large subunit ribosomal protein L5